MADCDRHDPISTIDELPEHATCICDYGRPEMHFKCIARNRTLNVASPAATGTRLRFHLTTRPERD